MTEPKHDPSTSGFWWIPAGLLLTAAAAIVLWWVVPPSADVRRLTLGQAEPEPTAELGELGQPADTGALAGAELLPSYVLETKGGLERSGASEVRGRHRYRRDTLFEWVLRPKVESPEQVGVRGFAFVEGSSAGLPLALAELVKIASSGTIQISGAIEQLDLEPGLYTIALAVGRPAGLPTRAAELSSEARAERDDDPWQVRRLEISIED